VLDGIRGSESVDDLHEQGLSRPCISMSPMQPLATRRRGPRVEVAREHMVDHAAIIQWVRGDRVICP
jgi:hypothetical protein